VRKLSLEFEEVVREPGSELRTTRPGLVKASGGLIPGTPSGFAEVLGRDGVFGISRALSVERLR
jgi:hypothetical protein